MSACRHRVQAMHFVAVLTVAGLCNIGASIAVGQTRTRTADAGTGPAAAAVTPLPQTKIQDTSAVAPFIDLTNPVIVPQSSMEGGIDKDSLINFAIWMVVIMCLCGLTVLGLRVVNLKNIKVSSAGGNSRIIDTLNLGKHRSVQLIEIGGRSVLVASDASGIRSVVPMTDQFSDALFDAEAPSVSEQQQQPSFGDYSPQDR